MILVASYDMPQRKAEVLFYTVKNQRTEGPESRTDGETLIFWD